MPSGRCGHWRGRQNPYLYFGDVLARLAGVNPDDDRWDDDVRIAFGLDDIRDVDAEAGYATDQLENIAWTAASSAQHSPQTAVTAVRALHDLLARRLVAGERDRSDRADPPDEEPIVYTDGIVWRVLGTLARPWTVACPRSSNMTRFPSSARPWTSSSVFSVTRDTRPAGSVRCAGCCRRPPAGFCRKPRTSPKRHTRGRGGGRCWRPMRLLASARDSGFVTGLRRWRSFRAVPVPGPVSEGSPRTLGYGSRLRGRRS